MTASTTTSGSGDGAGTEAGSGLETGCSIISSASTGVGGTYAVSTCFASAVLDAKLAIGVTWPATSNAARISDDRESNASLFAAGFSIKDSTPLRYFVASPAPPVCCAIANNLSKRIGSAISCN